MNIYKHVKGSIYQETAQTEKKNTKADEGKYNKYNQVIIHVQRENVMSRLSSYFLMSGHSVTRTLLDI